MLLAATSSMASAFRAADLVYVPAAGSLPGANNAFFRTDIFLANLSDQPVIVSVAFAPTGGGNNAGVITGSNPVNLPVLAPGERREIIDIMRTVFNKPVTETVFGHLLFFACRQGGNCADCDANPADCELISAEARIYTTTADGTTFGQLIPGIPWYNYVSRDSVDEGLARVFITGIRNQGSAGVSGFRTNIGLVNASSTSSTVLRVKLFNAAGVQQGNPFDQTLQPLGHVQGAIQNMFAGFTGTGEWVNIEQLSAPPTGTEPANPSFLAYGSLLDNRSNDPTYLEAQYEEDMDFACIYDGKPERRPAKRR